MIDIPHIVQTEAQHYACTRRTVPLHQIGMVMGPAIAVVLAALKAQGLAPVGPWFTHHLRRPIDFFDFEVCFPLSQVIDPTGSGDSEVRAGVWPAMQTARAVYRGNYTQLPHAWGELETWMKAQEYVGGGEFWEVYAVNPHTEPNPDKWQTELNWPLAE